jgi:hypothetical protein
VNRDAELNDEPGLDGCVPAIGNFRECAGPIRRAGLQAEQEVTLVRDADVGIRREVSGLTVTPLFPSRRLHLRLLP